MSNRIKRFIADESGQDTIEYALLCALMTTATVAIIGGIAPSIVTLFTRFQAALDLAAQ